MSSNKQQGYECPKCKNNYSTAYSMYRHMRKVHNCDVNRFVTLYCPIDNCNQSYDRYNALDTHLTHVHYADIRKETFNFSDLTDFEAWLRDVTSSSKTKYIKRSCNNSYRYYRCHRSGLPKTSTDKINTMKSSVKIGRHCPSRITAKITDSNVQVEFVPTHIGHECETAKIPLSQKKRQDIACRLANSSGNNSNRNNNNSVVPSAITSGGTQSDRIDFPEDNHNSNIQQAASTTTNIQINSSDQSPNLNNVNSSSIIQNDGALVVSLSAIRTGILDQQQQQQQQQTNMIGTTITQQPQSQVQTHLMQTHLTHQQQSTHITNKTAPAVNTNQPALATLNPNKQELTQRFDQLLYSIRSDKHASIVKAQLEVCFALIRD